MSSEPGMLNWAGFEGSECAQLELVELGGIERNCLRNYQISLKEKGIAQERANRPLVVRANLRSAHPSSLFKSDADHLSGLKDQVERAREVLGEKMAEAAAAQALVAPWYEEQRSYLQHHQEMVAEHGYKVGGRQGEIRLSMITKLDKLRQALAPHFREASRLNGEIKSLKNEIRGLETEIKIVKAKQKRTP